MSNLQEIFDDVTDDTCNESTREWASAVIKVLSETQVFAPEGVKTKFSHPYSYDPFTIWRKPCSIPNDSVYSDRLIQWDFKKHDELCQKHFGNKGQYWNNRSPELIEKFLRDYLDDPTLSLCEVIEGCNQSNGYPYWCFRFSSGKLS